MGGPRMTSAWDVEAQEFVTIRSGEAAQLRDACWAGRLVCPIADCSSPAITTRRQYENRWGTVVADGFKHRTAPVEGEHSAESVRHQDGKAAVVEWLRSLGFTQVRAEHVVRTAHRSSDGRPKVRRPDVHGRHPAGRAVAVEVQVSPLTEDEWRARTNDLQRKGRAAVWFWAWPVGVGVDHAATTALRAAAKAGLDLWFLDPYGDDGPLLGWAHQVQTLGGEDFRLPPYDFGAPLSFDWQPLADHWIAPDGTVARDVDASDAARLAAMRARDADRERRQQERAKKERQRLEQRMAEALAATAISAQEAEVRRLERLARAATRPGDAPAGPLTVGVTDACCRVRRGDERIWVPAFEWKFAVARRLLIRDRYPAVVARSDIVRWVEHRFPCDKNTVAPPVHRLLTDLRSTGVITSQGDRVVVHEP